MIDDETRAKIDAYVKEIVDRAPPLTAEQAALIRRILAPHLPNRTSEKTPNAD